MPKSSNSTENHQDWKTVVLNRPRNTPKKGIAQVDEKVVRDSRLDDSEQDTYRRPTCGKEFGRAIQDARMSKAMSRKQLAHTLQVRLAVIADCESGKAIISDSRFINKCQSVLGVKLPSILK